MRKTVNGIGGNSNCQPFRDMQHSFNTNEPVLFKMKDLMHNRRIINSNFNSSDVSQELVQSSYFYGVRNTQDNNNSFKIQGLNFRDPV